MNIVFGILAIPKNKEYMTHDVCFFSEYIDAKKCMGSGKSIDSDNGVEWNYTIIVKELKDLSPSYLKNLNKCPSHFPYIGW